MGFLDFLFGSADGIPEYRQQYGINPCEDYNFGAHPDFTESIPRGPARHTEPGRGSYYDTPRYGNDEAPRTWEERWDSFWNNPGSRYRDNSCYETLGVKPGASRRAIGRAYRRAAKSAHPDAGGSAAAFNRINAAYNEALKRL